MSGEPAARATDCSRSSTLAPGGSERVTDASDGSRSRTRQGRAGAAILVARLLVGWLPVVNYSPPVRFANPNIFAASKYWRLIF